MRFDTRTKEDKEIIKRENAGKISLGSRVKHKTFGLGEVIHIDKDKGRVLIQFEIVGERKLSTLDIFRYIEIVDER